MRRLEGVTITRDMLRPQEVEEDPTAQITATRAARFIGNTQRGAGFSIE